MDKIILVHYIDIRGVASSDIHEQMIKIKEVLNKEQEGIITYIIPTRESGSRVECINPKIVSEEDFKQAKEVLDRNQRIVDELTASLKQEKPSQDIKVSEK